MSKIPAINEIDANSPSRESKEVVVKATDVSPDINEIQETISSAATIQEVDGTRKPTISEIYKIVTDGLFESTSNWWDYAYKLSQAQINQDIISRLDKGEIGGGYSKGVDIITTTKNAIPTNTNVYSALKSDSLYPKKLNNETINGIYDFINGITIGKPTAYTGGTWSVDQLGKTHLTTDYLYVRLKAIFETLQILNVDTIGGKLVISPAGSITIVYVDNIKVTIDDNEQNVYRCYFLGEQEGEEIENKWKVGDQAQAKSFNVKKGTYHKTGNHYLWRLVVGVSTDTVTIDGKKYHYVDLSQLIFDVGSDAPAPGDVLNQLGHRGDDLQRQTAIVLNAVDNYAPSITLYAGITDFTLLNKEYVEYGVYQGKAFFNVYGDMYIGDKGINPTTYIKFKNGKLDIKANLTIGSSIDGKDLDKYIKENGGVDEKTVISLINNSQVIKDLQNQADGAIETWFYEGEPTLKNLPAVDWTTNELKKIHVGDLYYDQITGFAYRFTRYNDDVTPYAWNRIKDNDIVKALEAASHAQATADSKMKIFYGEAKPTNYQAGDMWVNATLAGKFNNDIARSTTKSETFDANHWVLASRYSEAIQSLLNWSNQYTTKFEDLTKIVKEQKDQSISNWFYDYEPTDTNAPANLWNTEELRKEHIGDIFYDTKNNHSYRWTGSAWSMIKDADFDEAMKKAKDAEDLADKKRQIFYSDATPTGADRGDLWMKQVGNKTEVWVFDGTNWVKSNDKALADYSEAINKELQGIKGQLDGKAETWYQADDPSTNWTNKTSHEGDIWYNTTDGTTQYWNGKAWEKMDIPKDVFDTIDGKSSIFVDSYDDAKAGKGVISNGYNERDIWILPADAIVNGVQYYKGDILTATADGTVFNEKHWTKKVRYVGDKELNNAIDKVNKKIGELSATTLPGLDDKFNEFAKDGIIDSSEKARLTDLLNQANNDVLAVNDQIISIIKSDYLTDNNVNKGKLIEAQKTLSTAWTEYKTLINTLISSTNPITKNNIAEASSKYTNLQNSIKAVKQYLAACQADILSNIGIDINSYKYLKEAFKGKTEVNGGLVVTNVLQLRQTSDVNSPITAGISGLQGKANENGVVDKDTYDITAIAAWFGGPMVDKDIFTDEQIKNKVAGTDYARSLFRHDGSGYLASGAIYWGTDGILHGNPNSFILQGTSLATMFSYIRLFYLHYANTSDEGIAGVDYITPTKTFSRLDILTQGGTEAGLNLPTGLFIGSSTTGGSFKVGNVIIRTKDGDPNILEIVSATDGKTAHLGVQGGVSAYGTYTSSTGGGGGLNATVVSYSNIIAGNYSDTDLTTIPNAYSIKALYNAIQNIDVTSQLGNYLLKTDAADTYQPKGNYLTTHQTIYGLTIQKNGANLGTYNPKSKAATINLTVPTKISELSNDSGYTNNIGTVTSVGVSVPTGLSITGSPITTKGIIAITFAEGYSIPTIAKQTSWDGISTLESYFTNDSAKKALQLTNARKLWGNTFNGTSDVDGSIIIPEKNYISIGGIKIIYDATNKALKIDGNLYSTGGISAYGTNDVSGGGGLNASVISYASILEGSYVDTDLTSIPNAYSIKALSNRIDNIATELGGLNLSWNNITGKPTTFTPSAHKHKWIDITDRITKVSQLTNDAGYLTTHQSLANYYTKAEIDEKGYTTNKGTVTSVGLTLPTGLVCATKTITTSGTFAVSFASGYSIPTTTKQSSWDSAVSAKHSHSNKSVLDGISSAKVTHWDSAYNWYSLMTTDEETADGIINKWNEVVNFLANIAQTDTLSGIINGINTSISNEVLRAKKAEGTNASNISANKTSITTLQGYFTNGSAKKALQLTTARKLWGNDFNGTTNINGSIVLPNGKYISIGNIKLEYDATNKALKITNTTTDEVANLYASGGVSAYGIGTIAGSGGLQGSIIFYDDAIASDPGDEGSKIASASSIYKLHSRISDIENNGATSISLTGTGNAITNVTKNGTDITFTKGSTFLTSHQSLSNYYNKTEVNTIANGKSNTSHTHKVSINGVVKTIAASDGDAVNLGTYLTAHQSLDEYVNAIVVSGTGNAVTAVTKTDNTITFTKGATYLTSHQSLAAYLKSADAAKTYASINHTHNVKINGTLKTIAPTGGAAVDLGTYLTSHQSLDGYVNTLTQPTGSNIFVTAISKNGKTLTYTKSYTKKSATAVIDSGWKDAATDGHIIPDMSFIAYWNGAFNTNGSSNLKYCTRGAFGSFAIKNSLAFSELTSKPTTIAGYGITDAYTKTQINTSLNKYLLLTGGTLSGDLVIGKIKFHYDSKNNAIAISHIEADTNANLYATGGLTAYGEGTSSSGGGLNGSVLSYDLAIKLISAGDNELSQLASAWSIAKLNSRISSLEGGSALDVVTSGTGNAVTGITKNGTTINVTKGTNFLTAHQSLDGYVNNITTSGAGNAITSVTKSGKTVTFTKGATFLTSHQSLSAYLKSADAANTYSKLGHTHSQYLTSHQSFTDLCATLLVGDGVVVNDTEFITSIADANGFSNTSALNRPYKRKASKLWEYIKNKANSLYQPIGNYATQSWVNNKGYITSSSSISGNAATATNADKVDGYHAYQLFRDLGWWNSSETHNANDIEGNASVFAYSTHSNVPTTGVLTTFSGGNDAYNWQMIKSYTSRMLYVRYRNGDNNTWSDWIRLLDENDLTWSNISNRPTKVSQFSNDSNYATQSWVNNKGYITSSGSISGNAATATNADKVDGVHVTWSGSLTSTSHLVAWEADGSALRDISPSSIKLSQFTDDILSGKYLSLNGGAMKANSRISASGGALYLGNADNKTWLYLQDAASQLGVTYWLIKANGTARFKQIYIAAKDKNFNEDTNVIECFDATLCLNWYSSRDINMCNGGGIVKIGTGIADGKLNVGGNILATGGITAYSSSDIRLKQDLRKLDYLNIIKAMGGSYGFTWRKDNKASIGWIAQHVLNNPYMRDIVETDENGYYKINYWSPKLIATAFGAIEQVDDEISRLKARVTYLESEVERLFNDNKLLMNK
nr:MAG TPA: Receptor recognition protein, Long tail, Helical sandwich, Tail fiber [Crassvirales sp.]